MSGVDGDKLNGLVGKMLGDLGGAFSVPTARIGFRLGLFDALHDTAARPPPPNSRTDRPDRALCARMGAGTGRQRLHRLRARQRSGSA